MRLKKDTLIILMILSAAVGINIGQFPLIERDASPNYRAINTYEKGDLTWIALGNSNNLRTHYMKWAALNEIAPNSTLYIPSNNPYNSQTQLGRAKGIGSVDQVMIIDIDQELAISNVDIERHVVAFGEDNRENYPFFAIATESSSATEEKVSYYRPVDSGVIQIRNDLGKKPEAEFLLVEWGGPDTAFRGINRPSEYTYNLIIETSLLDESVREKLQ